MFLKEVVWLRSWLISVFIMASGPAFAQVVAPNLPGDLVRQAQAMSPSDLKNLAAQSGINLDEGQAQAESIAPIDTRQSEMIEKQDDEAEPNSKHQETNFDESVLPRFGESIFDADVSSFAPVDNSPVPDNYILGVGDNLVVQLWGSENISLSLTVDREGKIYIPKLGEIVFAGLPIRDAREQLKSRVEAQLIGVEVSLTPGRLRAINIFISGEVNVPGAFAVSAMATVSQALFTAGGISPIGSLRNTRVIRGGKVVGIFDAYKLLLEGDPSGDIRLQDSDIVHVPVMKRLVEIDGQVRRPMRYEVSQIDTVNDLLAMAGGLTAKGVPIAEFIRIDSGRGLSYRTLNLSEAEVLNSELKDGDILRVRAASDELSDYVQVRGAVFYPGLHEFKSGLTVSDLVTESGNALLPQADRDFALLVRTNPADLSISLLQVDIRQALAERSSPANPKLKASDTLIIFSNPRFDIFGSDALEGYVDPVEHKIDRTALLAPVLDRLRRQTRAGTSLPIVSVRGAVSVPGDYPLMPDMSIDTIVEFAGGYVSDADLSAIEIRRVNLESSIYRADYQKFNVSGDSDAGSSYLMPQDLISVRKSNTDLLSHKIELGGEINFPGEYSISSGETISSVIQRAGGLTEDASVDAAVFTRRSVADFSKRQTDRFISDLQSSFAARLLTQETSSASISDLSAVIDKVSASQPNGRLLIDLERAIAGIQGFDLQLEDGDQLVIPKKTNTITVVGEVREPATHIFERELSAMDYISLSAGYTDRADSANVYVVKSNGKVQPLGSSWLRFDDNVTLGAGDVVVVPIDIQHKESLVQWREITQVLYQSIVSLAALSAL